jgi:hypothetical protein
MPLPLRANEQAGLHFFTMKVNVVYPPMQPVARQAPFFQGQIYPLWQLPPFAKVRCSIWVVEYILWKCLHPSHPQSPYMSPQTRAFPKLGPQKTHCDGIKWPIVMAEKILGVPHFRKSHGIPICHEIAHRRHDLWCWDSHGAMAALFHPSKSIMKAGRRPWTGSTTYPCCKELTTLGSYRVLWIKVSISLLVFSCDLSSGKEIFTA